MRRLDSLLVPALAWREPLSKESPMDMQEFLRNREQFPLEELARYGGKYVAWSPDGTKIIASDDDQIRLDGTIRELGYDPAEILVSSVPYPDEIILGGGVMEAEE
jgi:hypothetical protein